MVVIRTYVKGIPSCSSTNYQVLDATRVGTGAVELRGEGACAVLTHRRPFPFGIREVVEPPRAQDKRLRTLHSQFPCRTSNIMLIHLSRCGAGGLDTQPHIHARGS